MIAVHQLTTEPVAVTFAGCEWRLLFNMWAVRKLQERFAPEGTGLEGLERAQIQMAAGQIDALAAFVWAGLLWDSPGLTFDQALGLLEEAPPVDLVTLPAQILKALKAAFGESGNQGNGSLWDWELALAVWIKEWGRGEVEFWATTFRAFRSISNGLARLYKPTQQGGGAQGQGEGWTLNQLLSMNRGR